MTDQTMCEIPFHDGTTRLVPEGTVVEMSGDAVRTTVYVVRDGHRYAFGGPIHGWGDALVTQAFDTAPEPRHAGIDPDSITEWTWCLLRLPSGAEELVRQVRLGRERQGPGCTPVQLDPAWSIVSDDVQIAGGE